MFCLHTYRELLKEDLRSKEEATLKKSNIQSYEDYLYQVGILRGLKLAIDNIEKAKKEV
jgi:hypothetical protein